MEGLVGYTLSMAKSQMILGNLGGYQGFILRSQGESKPLHPHPGELFRVQQMPS
jgi:hypothetical protein